VHDTVLFAAALVGAVSVVLLPVEVVCSTHPVQQRAVGAFIIFWSFREAAHLGSVGYPHSPMDALSEKKR
jgi:hypothetical protein